MAGFVCPTVSMVATSHATGLEKTLLKRLLRTYQYDLMVGYVLSWFVCLTVFIVTTIKATGLENVLFLI